MYIITFPEEYWRWQQRMRREFPEHWEHIKDATDSVDVIMYMNWWLGTSVDPATTLIESANTWMAAMDQKRSGNIIVPWDRSNKLKN